MGVGSCIISIYLIQLPELVKLVFFLTAGVGWGNVRCRDRQEDGCYFNKRKIKQVRALICKDMEAVLVSEIIMSE